MCQDLAALWCGATWPLVLASDNQDPTLSKIGRCVNRIQKPCKSVETAGRGTPPLSPQTQHRGSRRYGIMNGLRYHLYHRTDSKDCHDLLRNTPMRVNQIKQNSLFPCLLIFRGTMVCHNIIDLNGFQHSNQPLCNVMEAMHGPDRDIAC